MNNIKTNIKFKEKIIDLLSLILSLFVLYTCCFGEYTAVIQRAIPLLLASILIFLTYPLRPSWRMLDIVLILATLFSVGYMLIYHKQLTQRIGIETSLDYVVGFIGTLITIEITRRTVGNTLPIMTGLFLIYMYFGKYFPSILSHSGLSIGRIVRYTWLSQEGIFGVTLGAMVSFVFLYILFGVFLEKTGAGKNFIDLAYTLTGTIKSGPAQAAVVSCALFGTISGSSAANVVATGTFTIPLMERMGYSSVFAASVVAAASVGGQLMPPIMGAAAFVMAEVLGKPYAEIMKAAIIPAVIFYLTIAIAVHLQASQLGLKGIPKNQLPSFRMTLLNCTPYLLPIFVLVFMLVRGYSTGKSGAYAIILLLIASLYKVENRKKFLNIIWDSLIKTGKISLSLWSVVSIIGIIMAAVTTTGLGPKFSELVVSVAGKSLFLALLLTMVASLIMGMGLPTVACYILLAILVAPALVRLGLPVLAAHFFVFYFGIISSLTPPVAIAAFAAGGVAKTDPMVVGWTSMRIAIAAFLLPFIFITYPELLMIGDIKLIFYRLFSTLLASAIFTIGCIGYFIKPILLPSRLLLILSGVLIIFFRGLLTDFLGLMMFLTFYIFHKKSNKEFN